MIHPRAKRVLIRFGHGLGDCVQFTILLQEFRRHHPRVAFDVAAAPGRETVFRGLCRAAYPLGSEPPANEYDQVRDQLWPEPNRCWPDRPSTKVARTLADEYCLDAPTRFAYRITPSAEDHARAAAYLPGQRLAVVHYLGDHSRHNKDLDHATVAPLCRVLRRLGLKVVILDGSHRSPLPDGRTIVCPRPGHWLWGDHAGGDAATLAALIARTRVFIGVDSGPLHVAMATATPCLAVWTGHHPIHYADLSGDVLHLIPRDHARRVKAKHLADALAFFAERYRFSLYGELTPEVLIHGVRERLAS